VSCPAAFSKHKIHLPDCQSFIDHGVITAKILLKSQVVEFWTLGPQRPQCWVVTPFTCR